MGLGIGLGLGIGIGLGWDKLSSDAAAHVVRRDARRDARRARRARRPSGERELALAWVVNGIGLGDSRQAPRIALSPPCHRLPVRQLVVSLGRTTASLAGPGGRLALS